MNFGLPYDSDAGRAYAAALSAVITGRAYAQSARIAETARPPRRRHPAQPGQRSQGRRLRSLLLNREPLLDVIAMHRAAFNKIDRAKASAEPFIPRSSSPIAATDAWDEALAHGEKYGYRNSQAPFSRLPAPSPS